MPKIVLAFFLCLFASPAWATSYYFSTSGSDSGAGTFASPWKTIAKMNSCQSSLGAGDRILLKEGDTWRTDADFGGATRLTVSASGSGDADASRFVIGAYGATAGNRLIRTNFTAWGGGSTRPHITGDRDNDGGFDRPNPTGPNDYYSPLVGLNTKNYVTIENIKVSYSTGRGIEVDNSAWFYASNIEVSDCQAEAIILFHSDTGYGVVEYSSFHDSALYSNVTGRGIWDVPSWIRPGQAGMSGASHHNTMRYCDVYRSAGEGVHLVGTGEANILEYSRVWDCVRPFVYVEIAKANVVRYNLVFGTNDATYNTTGGSYWCGGIILAHEGALSGPGNCEVYGNLIAGTKAGGILVSNAIAEAISGTQKIYNNTVVDCGYEIGIEAWAGSITAELKNNAFIRYGATGPLTMQSGSVSVTADYNFWTTTPTYFSGAHDIINVNPQLARASGWLNLTGGNENGSSFVPGIGSPLLDAVNYITSYGSLPTFFNWPTVTITALSNPIDLGGYQVVPGGGPPPPSGPRFGNNSVDNYLGCADAMMMSGFPTYNYGGRTYWETSKWEAGDHNHTLLKFTGLSAIPAGATISSATLHIYCSEAINGGSHTVTVRRLLRNWIEGSQDGASRSNDSPYSSCWNEFGAGTAWNTVGGLGSDSDRSSTTTGTISGITAVGWYTLSSAQLINDIQAFVNGTYSNYGWHLERTDGSNDATARLFTSREGTDGYRPYLEVTWTGGGPNIGTVTGLGIFRFGP